MFGRILLLITLAWVFTGCLSQEEELAFSNAFEGDQHQPPQTTHPPLAESCDAKTFKQPEAVISKKIDLLFVLDTSGSLDGERESVGNGIDAFLKALPPEVDSQIGVMLGHAGQYGSKLYRYKSHYPYVLKSTEYSKDDIRSILRNRMRNVKGERETDGGEAGLYSLYKALSNHNKKQSLINAGFLRDDAALVVVFVADENDICARAPEGVTFVPDSDGREIPAFKKYCANVTPESVYTEIKKTVGARPHLISGIIYNEHSKIKKDGENEIGYGYLELIKLGNGVAIDLAGGKYHEGLDKIATLATKKLSLITEFPLNLVEKKVSEINVKVDGSPVDFQYIEETTEVHLTGYAGLENSEVYISYCQKPEDGGGTPPGGGNPPTELIISGLEIVELTGTSVTVNFNTNVPYVTRVRVTDVETNTTVQSSIETTPGTSHQFTVDGLIMNKVYSLVVVALVNNAEKLSDPVVFRTKR